MITSSQPALDPAMAIYDDVLPATHSWSYVIRPGQILRIVDLGGNQAVDFLVYNAADPTERYSSQDTIVRQGNLFITTGTQLITNEGRVIMTVLSDTCGRHDTSGRGL